MPWRSAAVPLPGCSFCNKMWQPCSRSPCDLVLWLPWVLQLPDCTPWLCLPQGLLGHASGPRSMSYSNDTYAFENSSPWSFISPLTLHSQLAAEFCPLLGRGPVETESHVGQWSSPLHPCLHTKQAVGARRHCSAHPGSASYLFMTLDVHNPWASVSSSIKQG